MQDVCYKSWQRFPQPNLEHAKNCLPAYEHLTPTREHEDGSYQKSPYRVLIKWVYSAQHDICQPRQLVVRVHQPDEKSEAVNARFLKRFSVIQKSGRADRQASLAVAHQANHVGTLCMSRTHFQLCFEVDFNQMHRPKSEVPRPAERKERG